MSLNNSGNPYGGYTGAVDHFIGKAYPVVRLVADNMPLLNALVADMALFVAAGQSLPAIQSVGVIAPQIQALYEKLAELQTIYNTLGKIQQVALEVDTIVVMSEQLTELQESGINLGELVAAVEAAQTALAGIEQAIQAAQANTSQTATQLTQANQHLQTATGLLTTVQQNVATMQGTLNTATQAVTNMNTSLQTANASVQAANTTVQQANTTAQTVNTAVTEANQMLDDLRNNPPEMVVSIPRVQLALDGELVVPTNTQTLVPWNTLIADIAGVWVNTDPTKLTVPAGVTHARFRVSSEFQDNATGRRLMSLYKNSNPTRGGIAVMVPAMDDGNYTSWMGVSMWIAVEEGDFFQVSVWQDSGGDLSLNGEDSTWIEMELI